MGGLILLVVFLMCVFLSVPIGFSIGLSVVAYAMATGSVNTQLLDSNFIPFIYPDLCLSGKTHRDFCNSHLCAAK